MLIAAGSFFAGIFIGIILAVSYPATTHALLRAYADQIERLGGLESITSGAILRNNLRILLLSPILALFTLGLFPLVVVTLPGVFLGILAVQTELMIPLKILVGLLLVLPHGVFELPAIVIGSVLSMRLAFSLFRPVPSLSHLENVVWAAMNLCKGCVFLVIPLIAIAAWIEVNITGQIARWLVGFDAIVAMSQP